MKNVCLTLAGLCFSLARRPRLGRPALLVLLALAAAAPARAQGQLPRYRTGQAQLDQGQYAAALKTLEPLTQPINKFGQAPDAAYLYAVAASRLGQWAEAEQMLNLLRHEYPTYRNLPDVLLLQGQLSFELADFDAALQTLAQLPDTTLLTERNNLKGNYLPRLKDRATWLRLLAQYPQDAALGRAAADFLAAAGAPADRAPLDQLVARFGLERARYAPRPAPKAVRKASYNVAVLLPFELSDPSGQTQRRGQFVTDLYAGLRLAQDSLQRAGRPVQLFAYDPGPDTLSLKAVLALPELAGMDLLIGPVYKSGAKVLGRYAQQHQIACINPLSQDASVVAGNPWHYLFAASAATKGREAARFAFGTVGGGRPAIVLHEAGKDEADFAQAYKATFEELGGRVAAVRAFNPASDSLLALGFAGLPLAGAGHVVVLSDHRQAGPYALGVLRRVPAAQRPALLCPGTWLDNPRLEPEQLGGNTYFLHPKYFDPSAPAYRRFRALYLERQHLPPSVFASTGFELLLYFGQLLHQYGAAFQASLGAEPIVPGAVFSGLGYPDGAHDNQHVPFAKLDNLDLRVLNPPLPR